MSVLITTEMLGEHPTLSSMNTDLDLTSAWIRSGDGLVGFGEYKNLLLPVKTVLIRHDCGGMLNFQSLK